VNALDSSGFVVATVVGPPLAGIFVELLGPQLALVSICAVFMLAALSMAGVREPMSPRVSGGSLRSEAWQGILYTWRNRTLRGLAFAVSTANVTWGMTAVAVPLIVMHRLHGGPAAVGAAFAAQGLGGVLAAILVGRIDSRGRERAMLVWPLVGTAIALALLLPDAGPIPVVIGLAAVGLLNGPFDVAMFTLRQRRTEPAWIGRAFAVSMSVNFLGMPVGAALTGMLASWAVELGVLLAIGCSLLAAAFARLMIPLDDDRAAARR
jgi:predicted MFS family arabinose efflux permease